MGAKQSQSTSSTDRTKNARADGRNKRERIGASTSEAEEVTESDLSDGRHSEEAKTGGHHRKSMGTLLVVHNPGSNSLESSQSSQPHPVLHRLSEIPHFSPILQQRVIKSQSAGWINEKSIVAHNTLVHHVLDNSPYLNIGHLFQTLVHENAHAISVRQAKLTKSIKDYDKRLAQLMKLYIERQKSFAKHAEKLNKIGECTRSLAKCQSTIQSCKNTIYLLNQLLPTDERLEPFVWGEDNIELSRMN